MHDVAYQGNEGYVPDAAVNMIHSIQDQPQVPSFESSETLNVMKTNLVSSPSEPQVQGNGKPQDVTNNHRKISTRLPQAEIKTSLQISQVGTTFVHSRARNGKMSAVMQQSASQQNTFLANHITYLPHPPLQKISPQVIVMMEKDKRQNSNRKIGCVIQ